MGVLHPERYRLIAAIGEWRVASVPPVVGQLPTGVISTKKEKGKTMKPTGRFLRKDGDKPGFVYCWAPVLASCPEFRECDEKGNLISSPAAPPAEPVAVEQAEAYLANDDTAPAEPVVTAIPDAPPIINLPPRYKMKIMNKETLTKLAADNGISVPIEFTRSQIIDAILSAVPAEAPPANTEEPVTPDAGQ